MAAKKKVNRKALPVINKKAESQITDVITVDDKTAELVVKISVDETKGTFKVSTSLTTKNIHLSNEKVNEATYGRLIEMIKQGVGHALNERIRVLEGMEGGDPDQITADFGDDDEF